MKGVTDDALESVRAAVPETTRTMDAAVVRDWAAECVRRLRHLRSEIDDINVYPVADSDTGSNLLATVAAGHDTLTGADTGPAVPATPATKSPVAVSRAPGASRALADFASGAVRAARGNSGVILAQTLRGLADSTGERYELDGATLARALGGADALATRSVSHPVDGTMLSVLHAAADGAHRAGSAPPQVVADAAAAAAARAVTATTRQLPALAQAGVVDAGGRGLATVLDALAAALAGAGGATDAGIAADVSDAREQAPQPAEWEVMYLVDGMRESGVETLRERLDAIGDSVSLVADGSGTHAVHVHCADIGAAIEAGIDLGRPHRVRVESLPPGAAVARTPRHARGVVAVVRGEPLAALVEREGIGVLRVPHDEQPDTAELHAHIEAAGTEHVTVLAGEQELIETVERVARRDAAGNRDTVVVPCQSPVQLLAALAVHDPWRRAGEDVVAMAEAAAATRRGELRVATEQSLTWLGTAESGSLIGLVDGEVVSIERQSDTATDVADALLRVLGRMLALGGELVTMLTGEHAPEGLGDVVAEWISETHPEVEFGYHPGGQPDAAVLIGVE